MRGFMISHTKGAVRCAAPVISAFAAVLLASSAAILLASNDAYAAPAIRTTEANAVPQCVTPDKLMAFVRDRNPSVDPRYRDIANWYKHFGEAWHVRWDYAFYQMMLETNALKYRRGDGRRGDVREKQNNFAGIGATGHGAPGDKFPDIKTGVHAQIQHLVAYSGEHLADPVAARTQLVQDSIIDQSRRLRRPVTFGDLARRWAADRAYAKSIDAVAEQFRTGYCTKTQTASAAPIKGVPAPQPASRRKLADFDPPSRLGGPQPQMLAGPDDLPWTGETGPHSAITAQQDTPQAEPPTDGGEKPIHKAPEKQHKLPPVRTIWSRDGNLPPAVEVPRAASAEQQEPSKPGGTPKPGTAAKPEPPAKPAAETTSEPADDGAPLLPHFKIGPVTPSPSKLGGPVDAMPLAAAPTAQRTTAQPANLQPGNLQPVVRFKEIIVPGEQAAAAAPAAAPGPCRVLAASYGGKKTLLVRAQVSGETRYTALTVIDGFEKSMFDIYSKASAPKSEAERAEIVGEYPTKDEALADARANCPGG
jgi:Mannosyl-glycoprotein endo-beta-N-acetylglucosaminidase